MALCILSCGIFKEELEKTLPEIKKEIKTGDIAIHYVPAALHSNTNELEKGIKSRVSALRHTNMMLLYGNGCHPRLSEITGNRGVVIPGLKNCVEIMLNPERKKELDATGNIIYFTSGWLTRWREIFHCELAYNLENPRIIMEGCDKIIVLDTGVGALNEEELLILYDCTRIPIEIEKIDFDYFKDTLIKTLKTVV